MKKLMLTLALALATFTAAYAQFGVVGGWTTSKTPTGGDWKAVVENVNMFHAGVAYKFNVAELITLQPALSYQVKGSNVTSDTALQDILFTRGNFVEFDLGMQLGLDLLILRPYFLFEPFIGYDVSPLSSASLYSVNSSNLNQYLNEAKNKLEYGFGIGGGIELMKHLQVSVQWFMNGGKLFDGDKIDQDAALALFLQGYKDLKNYQGVKISLGLFF